MIPTLLNVQNIMLGLFVGGTFVCSTSMRLPSLLRAYAVSCVGLGGLAFSLALDRQAYHLIPVAIAVIVVKAYLIPIIINKMVFLSKASVRLSSTLRASTLWFVSGVTFALGVYLALRSPLMQSIENSNQISALLPISLGIILVGMIMMIVRRDVISQMIGFLIMENGIAAFSLSALGGVPVVIEFGVYSAVLIGAMLMATLSQQVQVLFGSQDTSHLTELID